MEELSDNNFEDLEFSDEDLEALDETKTFKDHFEEDYDNAC